MGTLAGELIKVSATSPVPVPSPGRVERGESNLPLTAASRQACADTHRPDARFENDFSSSFPPRMGSLSLPRISPNPVALLGKGTHFFSFHTQTWFLPNGTHPFTPLFAPSFI